MTLSESNNLPLGVSEVIDCIRSRWKATYDLQLVFRREQLYLQIMWGYLEQKSFKMNETEYRDHIGEILDIINRLNLASQVRFWLQNTKDKPRLGKALSLK